MAASSPALKLALATACVLLLCVSSNMARSPLVLASSPWDDQQERATAGELLLRELVEHDDLAEELGLPAGQRGGNVGDICPAACQTCLVACAVKCVLIKEPVACFANCTVSGSCFGKSVAPLPAARA